MTKKKMYRYLGRNGILTTYILLDGITHIPMLELKASKDKILTNGEEITYSVVIEESELQHWKEIPDKTN